MRPLTARNAFLPALLVLSACAHAQWTVVRLHNPNFTTESEGLSISAAQQGGRAWGPGESQASLWSGTSGSWTSLHPSGRDWSEVRGVAGGQQVGGAGFSKVWDYQACLWTGTAASVTYLHPAGMERSMATATDGSQQVGSTETGDIMNERYYAAMWSGSAATWINLDPPGSVYSVSNGVSDGQQVGEASFGGPTRAVLWTGSAGSWVSLHPAGTHMSAAMDTSLGRQVGVMRFTVFGNNNASLWSGTAASWVNLHPAGSEDSQAFGIHRDNQVGVAYVQDEARASYWTGTSGSWIDLGRFLPEPFSGVSIAEDVHTEGAITRVVGMAVNPQEPGWEAVMWVSRAIVPTSFTPVRGIVTGGNLASLTASDDNRLAVRPGIVFTTGEAPVQIRVDATAPTSNPDGIMFSVESRASFGNARQQVWLWNYLLGDYELVDTRLATVGDDVTNVILSDNAGRFVQPGTLAMRGLVTYRAVGPAFVYPWTASIDRIWWTFPG